VRGLLYKFPPGISAEIEAVAFKTGCGKQHLARLMRSKVQTFVLEKIKGKMLDLYVTSLNQQAFLDKQGEPIEDDLEDVFASADEGSPV
jgi:hypothetical protein